MWYIGKFTPSLLRGRIAIPVAPGAFSQKDREGVWMEVPGQPEGGGSFWWALAPKVLQCGGVPLAPGKGWHLNPAVQGCSPCTDRQHSPLPGGSGDPGGSVSPHCA